MGIRFLHGGILAVFFLRERNILRVHLRHLDVCMCACGGTHMWLCVCACRHVCALRGKCLCRSQRHAELPVGSVLYVLLAEENNGHSYVFLAASA